MSGIDIFRFFNNFKNTQTFSAKGTYSINTPSAPSTSASQSATTSNIAQQVTNTAQEVSQNLTLNNLQNIDRAIYAKEVLNLPKNLNEFVYILQRGISYQQFNAQFANQFLQQRNALSQLQAQILAQLQGINTTQVSETMTNLQLTTQLQNTLKNLTLTNGMLNLNVISNMLQTNGKEAITKLIMSMMEASKAGITDFSQMKDMAKLVNASISIASENNPQKTMKLLLLLYLPWLPLDEGIDFEIEMNKAEENNEADDSILTVTVTTKNYGVVKATIMLETSNSVDIDIECSEDFPKDELNLRISKEQEFYSISTNPTYKVNNNIKVLDTPKQAVSMNSSQTNQINPYLLLIAHTFIKQVIDIDNNKSLGLTSHID